MYFSKLFCLSPMSKKSVLEEFRVKGYAVIQEDIY